MSALVWSLLSWKNSTFFPLLGLLNSFPEKEGPAAEGEAKFRLEVFRCWFSPRSHNLHLEWSTDQSVPRQIFAALWLNKTMEFERFVCSNLDHFVGWEPPEPVAVPLAVILTCPLALRLVWKEGRKELWVLFCGGRSGFFTCEKFRAAHL